MGAYNETYCWEDINNPSDYTYAEGEKYDERPFKEFIALYPFVLEDDEPTETYYVSVNGKTESFHYRDGEKMLEKYPMLKQL